MVILFVKFRSEMTPDEVRTTMEERAPLFRAQAGLVQKYYAYEASSGEWSGIYFWESAEALAAFRESHLARSIPAAYRVAGTPRMEVLEVLSALRAETALRGWEAAGRAGEC